MKNDIVTTAGTCDHLATTEEEHFHVHIGHLLRQRIPGRNEKYYEILLRSGYRLTAPSFQLDITADAVIKQCGATRPTWYAYFRSLADYYGDLLDVAGGVMIEDGLQHFDQHATVNNWRELLQQTHLLIYLSNSKLIADFFPELKVIWTDHYSEVIAGLAGTLNGFVRLPSGQTRSFIKSLANELILHPDLQHEAPLINGWTLVGHPDAAAVVAV